ncbi:MAG: hypothetical protein K6G38_06325 [Gammaproteobacteria bacterium]|nr:hypothetical protein [Gammaproteobacteria bacterium]
MGIASVRETANFTNNTNAVTPYTLGQVLAAYATESWVSDAIAHAVIDPSQIDLSAYAKKTDLPKKLSELTNDANYVQTVGGLIPSNILPSFVDDVIEVSSYASLPRPGESGKIYVTLDNNLTYRWGGSDYVEISKSLALGTTSTTAFRGDYGQTAYEHSQATGNPHNLALSDLSITVSATEINYLAGLTDTIVNELAKKLNLSGGTLSGFLTLHADPTQRMHAATKDYVDKEINGISVTVTQNVTKISELSEDIDGLTSTVGLQADTLVEVQNDLTGLNQTTQAHTEAISEIEQDVGSITTTVSETQETVTHLEASVNQLSAQFDTQALFILVDQDGFPLEDKTYYMEYDIFFRGNQVTADTAILTGSNVGIETQNLTSQEKIAFTVDDSVAIANEVNNYSIAFSYTSGGFTYHLTRNLVVVTVPQGETGPAGQDGQTGPQGKSVDRIVEMYYKSTSPEEMTGGTWVTVYPGWSSGYYIWTKTRTIYNDTTYSDTDPIMATDTSTGWTTIEGVGITNVDVLYYLSTSNQTTTGGSWQTTVPAYDSSKYLWTKTRTTYSNDFAEESAPMCVTGDKGEDAIVLQVTSSNGLIFKDNTQVTVLSVAIYYGEHRITNINDLHSYVNAGAYLQWKWKRVTDSSYGIIASTDERLSDDGFTLTLDTGDIDTQVTFICELMI